MRATAVALIGVTLSLLGCASKKPISAQNKGKVPSLTAPEVRRIWIDDKIEGSRYIEGHYEYILDKPSVWSK
jgi:hypothetical protein